LSAERIRATVAGVRTLTVQAVDPGDEAALRDWFSVQVAARPIDEPTGPAPDFDDVRGGLPAVGDPYQRCRLLIALAGSEPVGAARVDVSVDSPQLAGLRLAVVPDHRRRGIGSALLAAAESWAVTAGCAVAISESTQWRGQPPVAGAEFAARHGYAPSVPGSAAARTSSRSPAPS
jgi:GNAT superfamily N-acetyltransferase